MEKKKWHERAVRATQGTFTAGEEPRTEHLSVRVSPRIKQLLKGGGSYGDSLHEAVSLWASLQDVLDECPNTEWAIEAIRQRLRRRRK